MGLKKLKSRSKLLSAGIAVVIAIALLSYFLWPDSKITTPVREATGLQSPDADLVGFKRDCVDGVLQGDTVLESCMSVRAIAKAYKVDVRAYLEEEKSYMIMTARRIVRGEILDMDDYKRCVQQGRCVYMSFVRDVAGKDAAAKNTKEGAKQALFWYLVNDGRFVPALCPYMKGCRALMKTGAISFGKK